MTGYTYYSTFISGLSPVIEKVLQTEVPDAKILITLDGLIVYQSLDKTPSDISKFPFFNNSYFLLSYIKENKNILQKIIRNTEKIVGVTPTQIITKNKKTFRIVISKENVMVAIPKQELIKLEERFKKRLKLQVSRDKPDCEVWFQERSEGYGFCGIRLTKKPSTDTYLQKGELRPELAWLLCFLSEPKASDIFLDPFTGYGSIPSARLAFPYTKIIASDNDSTMLENISRHVETHKWDAAKLPIEPKSIDKIVTDPPWGMFEKEDVKKLYANSTTEFARVLKSGGILVVITAQKELFKNLMSKKNDFHLMEHYNILVSGKKAGVYKYGKS